MTKGKEVQWVKPEMIGKISFTERTEDIKLSHTRSIELTEDKKPKNVKRQKYVQNK